MWQGTYTVYLLYRPKALELRSVTENRDNLHVFRMNGFHLRMLLLYKEAEPHIAACLVSTEESSLVDVSVMSGVELE